MMRIFATLTATIGMLIAGTAPAVAAPNPVLGTWVNPKHTLAVETAACEAGGLCGAIVRANEQALADARDAGVPQLIGLQLLQDYHPAHGGVWSGRVYVPDMGRSFSSRIEQVSPDALKISGCLVGGFLCKSQVWRRLK
ncbi:DUF2147 domain-containing protein [Sphingomonas sp. GB1N7]|uniref:DUF2147 domain-containing protein n=1 Tax=Parasphingomonas caseinilytica TaxID=3096158 RepID=UPI002FC5FF15